MDKKLDCRDIGLDCSYSFCAQTEDEVLRKAGEHVQAAHSMKGFSKEFYQKACAAIYEGSCETSEEECEGGICDLAC